MKWNLNYLIYNSGLFNSLHNRVKLLFFFLKSFYKLLKYLAQTDLEEAKTQEIAKLQESLEAMQKKVDEAKALAVKEREAAKKAIEEAPPIIKETPVYVEDTKKVESLTEEVKSLKVKRLNDYFICCINFETRLRQPTKQFGMRMWNLHEQHFECPKVLDFR